MMLPAARAPVDPVTNCTVQSVVTPAACEAPVKETAETSAPAGRAPTSAPTPPRPSPMASAPASPLAQRLRRDPPRPAPRLTISAPQRCWGPPGGGPSVSRCPPTAGAGRELGPDITNARTSEQSVLVGGRTIYAGIICTNTQRGWPPLPAVAGMG